jgi:hypothetical protein
MNALLSLCYAIFFLFCCSVVIGIILTVLLVIRFMNRKELWR